MAKRRFINTKFWSDGFIRKLKPEEKLLYLYLLTNEHTDICGVYEIDLETIAFETGLKMDSLSRTMDSLSKFGKILFSDGWIYIKNWKKHQDNNPKVNQGIKNGYEKIPPSFSQQIAAFDSLSIDYDSLSHSNSNSNSNLSKEREGEKNFSPHTQTKEFFKSFLEKTDTYLNFVSTIASKRNISFENIRCEIDKFCLYWTEKNQTGKKERWELEKTFEVDKRLNTWLARARDFPGQNKEKKFVFIS